MQFFRPIVFRRGLELIHFRESIPLSSKYLYVGSDLCACFRLTYRPTLRSISLANSSRRSGLSAQLVFTRAEKQLEGFASIPIESIPIFMHSTRVVPAPQKGSSASWPGRAPNLVSSSVTNRSG